MVSAILGPIAPAALAYGQPPRVLPDSTDVSASPVTGPTQGTVSVPILNVRAGPGTGFAIVGHASSGTVLNRAKPKLWWRLAAGAGARWLEWLG